ncbi:hypothetical protein CLIB1423_50S00188 [[Candida] railenensis]|uniref:Uncharacterized protein n=1 Tax=[Candida] railenensis TaxID=45579 RepID=A0A9P0QUT4_9ASCO|nr:hypothetical protein CLIB1423_50S00188 [[Candida] railenensis]
MKLINTIIMAIAAASSINSQSINIQRSELQEIDSDQISSNNSLRLTKRNADNGTLSPVQGLNISAFINGTQVNRDSVLEWEARRIQIVVNKMKHKVPTWLFEEIVDLTLRPETSIENITQERQALADAKIRSGNFVMRQLNAPQLAISSIIMMVAASISKSWAISEIHLVSNKGTAEGFAKWYTSKVQENDELAMLIACPDHYLLGKAFADGQEVIETTGGAILSSHFGINYNNSANLPIDKDPEYPVYFNGAAFNDFGMVVGGTNHQLRTLKEGFEIHPKIFFPSALPSFMISEHRWHLACEFSNWITGTSRKQKRKKRRLESRYRYVSSNFVQYITFEFLKNC